MSDDRNIERRVLRVVKVEAAAGPARSVQVTAGDFESVGIQYTTTADKAPRVGIDLKVTIEAVR
jgi:hypothetical protein